MMSPPWKALSLPDTIDIVAPDGTVRSRVLGYYSGKQFVIDDMTVDVREGDEIRRTLPNGREEAFIVKDPKFYKGGPFGPHYQVEIGRGSVYHPYTGGNYSINVSGPNSRVNIASTDRSTNSATGDMFSEIRKALDEGITDSDEREKLKAQINQLESARDQNMVMVSYQSLIASAANHMTIIAPFLPGLTGLLTQFSS